MERGKHVWMKNEYYDIFELNEIEMFMAKI